MPRDRLRIHDDPDEIKALPEYEQKSCDFRWLKVEMLDVSFQSFPLRLKNGCNSDGVFGRPALDRAAERFRELQAEKELRQLQEDRRNDKKPPPYKHIKVSNHAQVFVSMPSFHAKQKHFSLHLDQSNR